MLKLVTALALVIAVPVPAQAAKIIFAGTGSVDRITGRLTPTGTAPIASTLNFQFTFDPEKAVFFDGDEQGAFYDLPVSNFTATIGSHSFSLDLDPRFVPVLAIFRGFSYFGGNGTVPSLGYTIYLPGPRTVTEDPTSPFNISSGSRETLSLTALFRSDGSNSLGLDQLMDPRFAERRDFAFSATDPVRRAGGALQGAYTASFQSVGSVPEASTWVMMIFGFGIVGLALRRQQRRLEPSPSLA